MAIAFVTGHTSASIKVAGTNNGSWSTFAATTAGNVLVGVFIFDNAATASKPVISSIAVASGETASWVFLGAARSTSTSAGAFASGEIWAIKTTVIWPVSTTITFTLDTSVTMKAATALEFSGASSTLRCTTGTAYSTTTTAASATTTGTTPVVGDLAVGLSFNSNSSSFLAPPAGWTGGQGFGSTGGGGATNNFGEVDYLILTGAAHQTFASTAAATAGNGAVVAILQPPSGATNATVTATKVAATVTVPTPTVIVPTNATATPGVAAVVAAIATPAVIVPTGAASLPALHYRTLPHRYHRPGRARFPG